MIPSGQSTARAGWTLSCDSEIPGIQKGWSEIGDTPGKILRIKVVVINYVIKTSIFIFLSTQI